MSKVTTRTNLAIEGVETLQSLLISIIQKPQLYKLDSELRMALKTQAGISHLKKTFSVDGLGSRSTSPMSLNTLKTHANHNLAGGFKSINSLRLKAIEALNLCDQTQIKATKRTKSGLSAKLEQVQHELEMHRQTNVLLLRAVSEAMFQFTSIGDATDKKVRDKRTQDALQTLRAILSLTPPPFSLSRPSGEVTPPSLDVINLGDYRRI
ncbi:hypothetical protein [Stutzerimonas chloritidismutans]|uniref:hypothetical protein n=1 Tax=Stutzerimonas chloritidismutans TaxID=203192 RepID=UPI003F15B1F4